LKLSQVEISTIKKKIWILIPVLLVFILGAGLYIKIYSEIKQETLTSWIQEPSADCGIVLTGSAGRIREGISILTRGFVKKLIISGVHPDVELRELFHETPVTSNWKEEDVILEKKSATTYGNAQQVWPLAEVLGCRDIVLVTSQLHMRRAYKTFQQSFPEGYSIQKHTIPSSQNENTFIEISTEVLKSIFYSIWAY